MRKPLKRLIARFRKPQTISSLLSPEQEATLRQEQEKLAQPIKPRGKGRVIKQTHSVEFNPNSIGRGRVVRVMPRQLQKIKQGQEKLEDD
jgi:hypothetical protein